MEKVDSARNLVTVPDTHNPHRRRGSGAEGQLHHHVNLLEGRREEHTQGEVGGESVGMAGCGSEMGRAWRDVDGRRVGSV